MAEDPMDILVRMLRRAKDLEERIASLATMAWWSGGWEPAGALEEAEEEVREGVLRPLFQVHDLGDEVAIAVDLAGAGDDVKVKVYEDKVEVEASLRREFLERGPGYASWHGAEARYRAAIPLGEPVDPATARYERRQGLVVIFVRKAGR